MQQSRATTHQQGVVGVSTQDGVHMGLRRVGITRYNRVQQRARLRVVVVVAILWEAEVGRGNEVGRQVYLEYGDGQVDKGGRGREEWAGRVCSLQTEQV